MAGASNRILAGGNLIKAFEVTDGTTPTVGGSAVITLEGNILSTSVSRQDTGQYDVSVEHVEDNATLQTYLNNYINVTTASAVEELMFEDGTKEAAATSSNTKQMLIVRGGLAGGASGAARKVGVFPSRLKSSSGGYDQAGETYNRVSLEYEGYKLGGAVTLAASYFTSIMTSTTPVALTTSLPYGTVVYN